MVFGAAKKANLISTFPDYLFTSCTHTSILLSFWGMALEQLTEWAGYE